VAHALVRAASRLVSTQAFSAHSRHTLLFAEIRRPHSQYRARESRGAATMCGFSMACGPTARINLAIASLCAMLAGRLLDSSSIKGAKGGGWMESAAFFIHRAR
jgi:hypothetical protein